MPATTNENQEQVGKPGDNGIPDGWPSAPLARTIRKVVPHYEGRRVLVTGGFGFVGGHLVRALLETGAEVHALDKDARPERESHLNNLSLRPELKVIEADITDRRGMNEVVQSGRYHYIFHLAAGATTIEKALHDPYETILANTLGFVHLAEAARQIEAAERPIIVYSSTDKVYGETDDLPYIEEKSDLGGVGVYDSAKLAADIFAGTYHKALGVPTIVLRMCNLFGPWDFNHDYRLVPKAMRNIFRDLEPPELYFNAVEHFRDYLYVEDAVRAFLLLGYHEACLGRVYNLPGVHHAATPDVLREVVAMVSTLENEGLVPGQSGLKWPRSIRIVPSDPRLITISKQHLDGGRILREAEFEPAISFEEGLRNTTRFYHWLFAPRATHNTQLAATALPPDVTRPAARCAAS